MTNNYNNYSANQREKKLRALNKLKAEGRDPTPEGLCMLCCDPKASLQLHSEDYSEPFRWQPPHCYALCSCHWYLHQRFSKPEMWAEFILHVKRGGYASEFTSYQVRKEREAYREAKSLGERYQWKLIPGREPRSGWWEKLSTKRN